MNSAAPTPTRVWVSQTGVLLPDLPLQADHRRQQQGQAKLTSLQPPLTVERMRRGGQ